MRSRFSLRYRGVYFRSTLDAEWAAWMDSASIPWVYLEAGECADFFLPGSRQYLVVRAMLSDAERARILAFARNSVPRLVGEAWGRSDDPEYPELAVPDVPVIVAGRGGQFYGLDREGTTWKDAVAQDSAFCHCVKCDGWWVCAAWHSWACQCCRHYDGNADCWPMHDSPLPGWPTMAAPLREEIA